MAALVKTRGQSHPGQGPQCRQGHGFPIYTGQWGMDGVSQKETGAQAQRAPCNTHFCKTSCFHFLFSLEASSSVTV